VTDWRNERLLEFVREHLRPRPVFYYDPWVARAEAEEKTALGFICVQVRCTKAHGGSQKQLDLLNRLQTRPRKLAQTLAALGNP